LPERPDSEPGLVLIADPDAGRRQRVRAVFSGWQVVESTEPAILRELRPDAVVAGVRDGGLDILRELRDLGGEREAAVVLLGEDRDACILALEAGADDFLFDPFDPRDLLCRVMVRLRERRERCRAAERERDLLAEAHMAADALERSRRAEEALRESEERFRLASEAISGLVYDWDVFNDRVRRSPGLFNLLGWHPEEVDHQVGWWTRQIDPEDWEQASQRIYASIASGEPLFSAEYRVRHKDGRWVYVWDRGFIVRDEAGRPMRVVGSAVDVSDRRRAEEELKAANEAKDHFLATLSHELRTPLTPVLALVSSLQEDDRLPADLRGHLTVIRRNVELEARLIDDLLDLTRVARGKLVLQRQPADVAEVLAHALRSSRSEMAVRGVHLVTELAPGRLIAWADPARLTQVFWNLLSNACKFTPEGGTITVRSRLEDSVLVEISDTGIGIEPDVLPRIFGAFEQADRRITRRFGGLGLGLAVSRALVRLHGGDLTAASEGAGRGATFTVRIPAGVPERDLDDTVVTFPREAEPRLDRGLRLLLVEDHADTAQAMADLLRTLGHEVTVAGTVAGALEAAQTPKPDLDLVISDLGLPDGSGLELMRELAGHGLRGIALSGYGMDEDIQRSREAGFTAHLTKPVSLQTLQEAILQATRR